MISVRRLFRVQVSYCLLPPPLLTPMQQAQFTTADPSVPPPPPPPAPGAEVLRDDKDDERTREVREARETLKKEWDEAIKKTKPKDTAAGLKSGLATAAAGVASGVVGLFAAPIVGAKQDGASGFAKGLATGGCSCALG